ncbi:RluA family pseudouridine synthase [Cognatitamlana onchidii]|uniref:RluA family pseudouridine synthase n=1 Tax=Cognatitamlana onchidii TaxID=2562860 RepID=UPI0010A65E72|nr:RluA family pseudouridine synthase [Algibacter onchidii]
MQHFTTSCFHPLKPSTIEGLPRKFTFPFYYEPHPLSLLAAQDLQEYLSIQRDFEHNFGLKSEKQGTPIGKMFGVMVVKNRNQELGYLAAFSGKLAESNAINGFVPPIYDTLNEQGFYKRGEAKLNDLTHQIKILEEDKALEAAHLALNKAIKESELELKSFKTLLKQKKKARHLLRKELLGQENEKTKNLLENLKNESIYFNFRLRDLKLKWDSQIEKARTHLEYILKPINELKSERAHLSTTLQKQLHEKYNFLNANGELKNLVSIFEATTSPIPPAAAGECAAPKLFQYAYRNNLTPVSMAEFWWGDSPKSEVRKHKQFYPSCRSKCEPILGHMMQGLLVDDNPIGVIPKHEDPLDIVYEDQHLLLVNKPHHFLSVPGKQIKESVLTKMKAYLPDAQGPLLVHRLDMSTSGLLLVAKSMRVHKYLQKQFINRLVKKRYVAVLEGVLSKKSGSVELPLRVDLDNRPNQLVCYKHGKHAKTKYEVVSIEGGRTRVHFYPITGRTHQLRVHAAHVDGLNMPIVGDDLYGTKANRLHLHAEFISFMHPITKQVLEVSAPVPF